MLGQVSIHCLYTTIGRSTGGLFILDCIGTLILNPDTVAYVHLPSNRVVYLKISSDLLRKQKQTPNFISKKTI